MKTILLALLLTAGAVHGQYTYWTYDGSGGGMGGSILSIKARIEDSLFHVLGANYNNGQRVYSAKHSLHSGELLELQSSNYATLNYFSGSGDPTLNYYFLPESGYLVLQTQEDQSGWGWPEYIRLDDNLDTLWTSAPREFNDPYGVSYDNLPMFALPLWDGSLFSIMQTIAPSENGRYIRFIQQSMETGAITNDNLWNPQEIDVDGSIYGVGLYGGIQTDTDSIFLYGVYIQEYLTINPLQSFRAKFDLEGNLGSFKLYDLGNTTGAKDGNGPCLINGDSIIHFYTDGVGINDPFGVEAFPARAVLKVITLNKQNLETIEDHVVDIPEFNDSLLYGGGFLSVIESSEGGYIGTIAVSYAFDSINYYIVRLNADLEVSWYKPLLINVFSWYNYVLLETPDGGIITGGGLLESTNSQRYDYFIKLDACGYMVPSDCPEFVNVQEGSVVKDGFKLWPNPSSGRVDAIVPQGAKQLRVFDAQGRCVYQEALYYPRQTWNLSALPHGVYTFSVLDEHGTTWQQRWVKVE